jgi:hypothetical protein
MLAHLIYIYDKIYDAQINQELSRQHFPEAYLIQTCNGPENLNYTPYLEDKTILLPNRGHFRGAVDLINAGVQAAVDNPKTDFLLVTAGDSWFIQPDFVINLIQEMRSAHLPLAATAWGTPTKTDFRQVGLSLDCFVLDLNWQRESGLFPLNYDQFLEKFQDINFGLGGGVLVPERCLSYQWVKFWEGSFQDLDLAKQIRSKLRQITEREPIHNDTWSDRRMAYPEIGLYTFHDLDQKKALLHNIKDKMPLGPAMLSFLNS